MATLMPSRTPGRPRGSVSAADAIRLHASQHRVFSYAEAEAALGADAARSLGAMVTKGDLASPAAGIFTLPEIPHTDRRVVAKIEETGAKRTPDHILERRAAKAEERRVRTLQKAVAAESMTDRVRRFAGKHSIFSKSDVRREFGVSGPGAIDPLVNDGTVRQVQPGLYCRPDLDPGGAEMREYITSQGNEFAEVRRQIDDAIARMPRDDREIDRRKIAYKVFTPDSTDGKRRKTRVYVNVPGYPSIYAVTATRKGTTGIEWHGQDKAMGPLAAEMIARRVFKVMPPSMSEFIAMVTEGSAPTEQRTRTGAYEPQNHPSHTMTRGDSDRDVRDRDGRDRDGRDRDGRDRDRDGRDARAPVFQMAYGPDDTKLLDPEHMTTPLPSPVTLEMDHRDPDRIYSILGGVPNLHVVRTTLEIGDFRARFGDEELIFERKTSDDFVASLDRRDGRLVRQVRALSERGSPCCIIVEGGVFGARAVSIRQLARAKSRLMFGKRIPVAETLDQRETAYFMVAAIHDHFFGADAAFELEPVRDPSATAVEVSISLLRNLPGVSKARAIALLDRFGSIAGVTRAGVDKLRTVEGIGLKTANAIHDILRAGEKRIR